MSDPACTLFPDLESERRYFAHAEACRQQMIAALRALDPEQGSADRITTEYIEMTVHDALEDLEQPGTSQFFGRLDTDDDEAWYVGRRHIHDAKRTPVVVDWRAPIAEPFYRATNEDRCGVRRRRRFSSVGIELTGYLDEQLDDPDAPPVAGGIPDPLLAEIGAARSGAMREIVATIQAEQDRIIRLPLRSCLAVQGGPGTGKTAVGLHRVAYLLFHDRRLLARDGVLVLGPNRVFLDYISKVLPSLGERSVRQATLRDIAAPKVHPTGTDPPVTARVKGSARMADVIFNHAINSLPVPRSDVSSPFGARTVRVTVAELVEWRDAALAGSAPLNVRRQGFRTLVAQQMQARTGVENVLQQLGELKRAVDRMWPRLRPVDLVDRLLSKRSAARAAAGDLLDDGELDLLVTRVVRDASWTHADQILVDEAAHLVDGVGRVFGLVVVDEAQDLSEMELRAVGHRCPAGAITMLGDLAQATSPGSQRDWSSAFTNLGLPGEVVGLSVSYRLPSGVAEVANRLLPLTGAPVEPSHAVRGHGEPVVGRWAADDVEMAEMAVEALIAQRAKHRLSGIIAPSKLLEPLAELLAGRQLEAVDHVQDLAQHQVPVLGFELAKGLELDGVVVCGPEHAHDGSATGARLFYIAVTRAVQSLAVVTTRLDVLQVLGVERMDVS